MLLFFFLGRYADMNVIVARLLCDLINGAMRSLGGAKRAVACVLLLDFSRAGPREMRRHAPPESEQGGMRQTRESKLYSPWFN